MSNDTPEHDKAISFGEQFRMQRKAAGVTVAQVAKRYVKQNGETGCDPSHINAIEKGKYAHLSRPTQHRLNKALRAAMDQRTAHNLGALRGPGFYKDAQNIKSDFGKAVNKRVFEPATLARKDSERAYLIASLVPSVFALSVVLYILIKGV